MRMWRVACIQVDLYGLEVTGVQVSLATPGLVLNNGVLNLTKGCRVTGEDIRLKRLTIQSNKTALLVEGGDCEAENCFITSLKANGVEVCGTHSQLLLQGSTIAGCKLSGAPRGPPLPLPPIPKSHHCPLRPAHGVQAWWPNWGRTSHWMTAW